MKKSNNIQKLSFVLWFIISFNIVKTHIANVVIPIAKYQMNENANRLDYPFSFFSYWIGMDIVNEQNHIYYLLMPILGMLLVMSVPHRNNLKKIALWGGVGAMTPAIVDLVITSYFLPYIKPDASTVYFCLSPLNFCADLFYTSPMMYVLLYVIWGGVIGGIISIICCLLGIVLKNNIFAFGFLSVFLMMNKEICDLNQWEGYCYYYLVNPGQPVEQLEGADFIRLIAGLIIIIAGVWSIERKKKIEQSDN